MLVDYLIKTHNDEVTKLSENSAMRSELKRQHYTALKYRIKRLAATKQGVSGAFLAGVIVQNQSNSSHGPHLFKKYGWLVKLLT